MISVRINDKARGAKQLIKHLNTFKFVEFGENEDDFNAANAEFEALEKQCITSNELIRRVCVHIDELFDAKEYAAI
jgi:hypothetical protein